MRTSEHIAILGGGPAGLGAGYFLKQLGCTFRIYEAADQIGGNCVTLERHGFRYDSGAHRFHDKDPEITSMVMDLMGDELLRVDAPSAIYNEGRFVDFPLSPLNLVRTLGLREVGLSAVDWLVSRVRPGDGASFEVLAVNQYGRRLAQRFLLGYSEKLWGVPAERLSPGISGGRLKGLTLSTFILEGLFGLKKKTAHLDGSFLYPRDGYGAIADRLANACGRDTICPGSRITRILHDDSRITAVEVNNADVVNVDVAVTTLPLPEFVAQMDPAAPNDVLEASRNLRFRDVLLVGMILDRADVMPYATLYFPAPEYPFTRVYEPRNRSAAMSPDGKTSLFAEIPIFSDAPCDPLRINALKQRAVELLCDAGLFARGEVQETFALRLPHAYPVLEAGVEVQVTKVMEYLATFDNLFVSGRNGRFEYAHVHNMLRWGKDAAEAVDGAESTVLRSPA